MSDSNSFQRFVALSGQDEAAARAVFDRFAARLIALARSRLNRQIQQKEDAEDVVQSVYRSFCARHAAGEFHFDGWENLWSLLVTITLRKCSRRAEYWRAQQRDPRREAPPPADDEGGGEWRLVGREPSPDEAALLAELTEELLRPLGDRERRIVTMSLQEYSAREIAEQLQCSERTVGRVLRRVRLALDRQCVELEST